ncbi:MAG: tetratricopeptide repeat protein [Promethearchaeota archaeon]
MAEQDEGITRAELEQLIKKKKEKIEEFGKISGKNSEYIRELGDLALLQLTGEYYEEAKNNFFICLKHFKRQRDRLGQAAMQGLLGTLYFKRGNYNESIERYKKAARVYKELVQHQELIMCLKGIGNSFIKLNKLDDACDIFLECSSICSDNNDIYGLLECLGNLVLIYESNEKWEIVLELYKKTLKIFKKLNDNKGIIVSYFNLGILEKKQNNYDKALIYFKKGTNQAIDSNYAEFIIKGLGYVGETLFYLGRLKDAKNEYIKALHIAKNIKAKNAIFQIITLLKSLGLSDQNIEEDLRQYKEKRKQINKDSINLDHNKH